MEPVQVDLRVRKPKMQAAVCFRCGEQTHSRDECFSFRVQLCTGCPDRSLCRDAHGVTELRFPCRERCVRVVKDKATQEIYMLGCWSQNHTFRSCNRVTCELCGDFGHWRSACPMFGPMGKIVAPIAKASHAVATGSSSTPLASEEPPQPNKETAHVSSRLSKQADAVQD